MPRHTPDAPDPEHPSGTDIHSAATAWDDRADAGVVRALREWHQSNFCPRCGRFGPVDFGARLVCGNCGCSWQADCEVGDQHVGQVGDVGFLRSPTR